MPLTLLAIARVAAKQGEVATASKLLREALPIAHQIRDEATAEQIAELLAGPGGHQHGWLKETSASRCKTRANVTCAPSSPNGFTRPPDW